jgi:hypothetical protein
MPVRRNGMLVVGAAFKGHDRSQVGSKTALGWLPSLSFDVSSLVANCQGGGVHITGILKEHGEGTAKFQPAQGASPVPACLPACLPKDGRKLVKDRQ